MSCKHFLLLFVWIAIGACLRFVHLNTLPPWTDESATIVFSLGNSFYNVPLDRFIGLETLLEPLQVNLDAGIGDVVGNLLKESTHPPVYFALTHLWLQLFPSESGLVSLWAARSLSALLGVMAIPAIFCFTRYAFSSLIAAQIAAGMMAVSPFGIFLAAQARHYTLVILLIISSLSCFICAFRSLSRGEIFPFWLVLVWIAINCLGIATHYFFVLTLAAMAIAFIPLIWRQFRQDKTALLKPPWQRIYLVGLGSLVGCLVWLPALQAIQDSPPTDWVYESNPTGRWIEPIGRFLLWIMSMTILLPSSPADLSLTVVIISGLLTLIFWLWGFPRLVYGLKLQQKESTSQEAIAVLGRYLLGAIALIFFFTYILGMDLTLASRFHFIYFPILIIIIAASLSSLWQDQNNFTAVEQKKQPEKKLPKNSWFNPKNYYGRRIVITFLSIGLVSGAIANFNLGYLQNHRPDLLIKAIKEGTKAPLAIATTYRHHGQTGRIIGLAWGLKNLPNITSPQFFLATKDWENDDYNRSVARLQQDLTTIKRPLDLWLVNFRAELDLEPLDCFADSDYRGTLGQYTYDLYRCSNSHFETRTNNKTGFRSSYKL